MFSQSVNQSGGFPRGLPTGMLRLWELNDKTYDKQGKDCEHHSMFSSQSVLLCVREKVLPKHVRAAYSSQTQTS